MILVTFDGAFTFIIEIHRAYVPKYPLYPLCTLQVGFAVLLMKDCKAHILVVLAASAIIFLILKPRNIIKRVLHSTNVEYKSLTNTKYLGFSTTRKPFIQVSRANNLYKVL
uniref:Uncharacterized protein n=1 Tax=Glossina pallidipes TaxID=7398 RepID=A0A1A9ZXJ6_GLOPL